MTRALDPLLNVISAEPSANLHVIDIENLAGTGLVTEPMATDIGRKYADKIGAGASDVFLIAAGPQNKEALFNGWRIGRPVFQFRKGKDGADQALLSLFEQIEHPEKFSHIYLASGDGGLAPIAERSTRLGIDLTVVTGKGSTSWKYGRFDNIRMR